MSLTPREIPTGAVRYNTDSNKMEVYIGDTWMEVAVSSPNLDGGVRGIIAGGGNYPNETVTIQFITISTQGNSTDFGDSTQAREGVGGMSNTTRAVFSQGGNYGNTKCGRERRCGKGQEWCVGKRREAGRNGRACLLYTSPSPRD